MTKTYLKRIASPKTWPILRRNQTFISRPKPSGHKLERTLPVVVILRDLLELVQTAAQVRKVLLEQSVTVNGARVYDTSSPVGFMDVLSVDKKHYRMLLNKNNQLIIANVPANELVSLARVEKKTRVHGGKLQINLQGGRNILVEKDAYKVGDTLAFSLDGKIAGHYPLEQGAFVLVTGGSHIGSQGTVRKIDASIITIEFDGKQVQTKKAYAFVLGTGKSSITFAG